MEAVVISNFQEKEYYNSYIIKGKNDIYKNKKFILYTKSSWDYGDLITLEGTFYKPHGTRNYKGFNYKQYLQSNNIYGTIKSNNIKVISKNDVNILLMLSNNVRNKIINNIKKILPKDASGLLTGLILGDKTGMEEETMKSFQKSSLAHILAISGAHVSYIILGLTYFITYSKAPKKNGYVFIIFCLIFFLFLTNFSVSVIRASIMAIIIILSKLLYRKADTINTLTIAILITIISNPFSIFSVSFELSYLGTVGVIFLSPIISNVLSKIKIPQKISKIFSIPISAQIMILPIMIINFNTISLTFLISNIIAMPLLGFAIIGGGILILISFLWLWFAKKLAIVLNIVLKLLINIAKFCAELELSNIYVVTPNIITIIIYYFLVFIIIYIFNLRKSNNLNYYEEKIFFCINIKKILAVFILIIIVIELPYSRYNGQLKIYFIDVMQRR